MPVLTWIALGWIAGTWAGAQWPQPLWLWLVGAVGAGALLGLGRARVAWRPALVAGVALTLAGARYQLTQPPLTDPGFVAAYNGQLAVLTGVVANEPDVRDTQTQLQIDVESVQPLGAATPRPAYGRVLVSAPRYSAERLALAGAADWRYGDRVRVLGALETPPNSPDFSYRDYLARLGVYTQVRQARLTFEAERQGVWAYQAIFEFKAHALATLARLFPEPHAALLQGILLGNDAGLPAEVKDAFSATGTSHIIAISGFNIAILVGIFMTLFSRLFGAKHGAWLTILVIAAYTVLVGASASVVRAAIMGSLGVIGQRLGRRAGGLNGLAAAALLMTIANPLTLWDVGFQLSVAATLGLILYADAWQAALKNWLTRWMSAKRAAQLAGLAGELFILTSAAQLTTLPLLAYYFRSVSLISLAANLLILPPQPQVMVLGGVALLLGLVWLPLGQVAAWLAWPFTAYTLALVNFFAHLPGAVVNLTEVAPALLVGFYAGLLALTWLLQQPVERRPAWWATVAAEWLPAGGVSGLVIAGVLAWSAYFSLPDPPGQLRATIFEVGAGDAVLIQTPGGGRVLVDGGPSGGALARSLARHLPLFNNRLDALVIAGAQDASVGGVPDMLARYRVDRVILTQASGKSPSYKAMLAAFNALKLEPLSAASQPVLDLGDGARLRVLQDDVSGSVLRLEWARFALVLPVGLEAQGEADFLARTPVEAASALLVTRPGSAEATTEAWVRALNPQLAVITAGVGEPPAPAVLDRLAGRTVLRTDLHGAVTLVTDGQQLWVEAER